MKICVTAIGNTLDAPIDPRVGRATYFIIVDSENMDFEAIPNSAEDSISDAGVQAVQKIGRKRVDVLITGNVGPNAFRALASAGIRIVADADGTVRQVVEEYLNGKLKETEAPTVNEHFGKRKGIGLGRWWRRRF